MALAGGEGERDVEAASMKATEDQEVSL
jgi:hypothetical protein